MLSDDCCERVCRVSLDDMVSRAALNGGGTHRQESGEPSPGSAAQRLSAFMFNGRQYRKHDFNDQFRLGLFVGLLCCSGTKNVFYGDAVTLPCKLIPAPWTADPLQDAVAHQ